MKIAFLHPDLGIGGAERLVVDAALALKSRNHEIRLFTNHHDPSHCFPETNDGSLPVDVVGDSVPRSILGRCLALCAYLRMVLAALYLVLWQDFVPDLVFCDQISACIPILKWKGLKVLFYCHFPDKLLTRRTHWLKRLYRYPLDWMEEKTTGMADVILVNSQFTAQTFRKSFPSLKNAKLEVVYPSINPNILLRPLPDAKLDIKVTATTIFLSINRYERKKNIVLAIEAMGCLRSLLPPQEFSKTHLIVAGGYDERVEENRLHFDELGARVQSLNLDERVSFLRSPSDDLKKVLFHCCTAVLYTPSEEHFGIVPLEAMLLGRPVLAVGSGGPLETVLDGQTGFLCEADARAFADKMLLLSRDKSLARELGSCASEYVRKKFSFQNFVSNLNSVVEAVQ